MSERCNISPRFSMKFFGRCNISRTFGFYNTFINRQEALKGVLNMSVLQTIDLKKYYGTKPNITRALDGVNFSVEDGEFVAIVGTSGSGKSTLLHLLSGLDKPTSGSLTYDGKDIYRFNDKELSSFRRRRIGFIFQQFNLLPVLTAKENIIMPLLLDKKQPDEVYLNQLTDLLGIRERLTHLPHELSGGQQQRVAIARAVVTNPKLILADEPTGNLDSKNGAEVMNLLTELNKEGTTIIMVTHSQHDASFAHRTVHLFDGSVVASVTA